MYSRRAGTQSQESVFSLSVVRLVDWPQAPTFDQGLAALPGQRWLLMGVEELVSGPWGSHAHSANTEGQWEAPGDVPHWGHRTMLW